MDALRVPVAEADLPALIERVAAGEQVVLTRDGQPVAELRQPILPRHKSPEAREAYRRLVELRESLPPAKTSSVDLLREMYDEKGY